MIFSPEQLANSKRNEESICRWPLPRAANPTRRGRKLAGCQKYLVQGRIGKTGKTARTQQI